MVEFFVVLIAIGVMWCIGFLVDAVSELKHIKSVLEDIHEDIENLNTGKKG